MALCWDHGERRTRGLANASGRAGAQLVTHRRMHMGSARHHRRLFCSRRFRVRWDVR